MSEQQNGVAKDADGLNERHNARMARKKEVVDKKIEAAKRNAGVLVITCGNGKGKSSSAFGIAARALGHGMKVGVVQFIKGAIATGEENFFRRFPDEISFHVMGEGYTWETQNRERDVEKHSKPGSARKSCSLIRPSDWWCWMN